MPGEKSVRDALMAEILGDMGRLLDGVESLNSHLEPTLRQFKETADSIAKSSAESAKADLAKAAERAIGDAAERAFDRIQMGRSAITIWLATAMLGVSFGLGWLGGSHILSLAQTSAIRWQDLYNATGNGIGVGFAIQAFLVVGILLIPVGREENRNRYNRPQGFADREWTGKEIVGWILLLIAIALASYLIIILLMLK